ncbi:NADH-quinone oxidoreductase subunit NuoE [Chloroflexota bacterium]
MSEKTTKEDLVQSILSSYKPEVGKLVPILLQVQNSYGYLPAEAISKVADFLGLSEGHIYSVASFYAQFRLKPVGRHRLTVCQGTSCYIHGAAQILAEMEKETGIQDGETSEDMAYTLESVACIGCCALAPVVRINSFIHGEMTQKKAREVLPSRDGEKPDDA